MPGGTTTMMWSDSSLVRSTLGGEARAFEKLVMRYQGAVFAIILENVRDTEAARDLVQETFVRAYTRLETLRDPGQFSFWMYRIARNLSLDWLSSRPRTMRLDRETAYDPDGVGETMGLYDDRTPDVVYEEEEMKHAIWHALDALPAEVRGVILLRHMEGMRIKEIAVFLGLPITTVKGRLERGRRILREHLVDLGLFEDALQEERPDRRFATRVMAAIPFGPETSGPVRMFPLPMPHMILVAFIVFSLAGIGWWRAMRDAGVGAGYPERRDFFEVRRVSPKQMDDSTSLPRFAPPAKVPESIELRPIEIVQDREGTAVPPPHDGENGSLGIEVGDRASQGRDVSEILSEVPMAYGRHAAVATSSGEQDRSLRIGLIRDPSLEGITDIQPMALRNLIHYLREHVPLDLRVAFDAVALTDLNLERYEMLYLAGTDVTAPFSAVQASRLGRYLREGGFLFAEDLLESGEVHRPFLTRIRQVLRTALGSEAMFAQIPWDHPLFCIQYRFRDGPPVLHRDGTARYIESVEIEGRLCALLSRACLSLQWSGRVHGPATDSETGKEVPGEHEPAVARGLQFGVNLIRFVWETR